MHCYKNCCFIPTVPPVVYTIIHTQNINNNYRNYPNTKYPKLLYKNRNPEENVYNVQCLSVYNNYEQKGNLILINQF